MSPSRCAGSRKPSEYSPGTIYPHFKDKETLIKAILRRDTEDLRNHLLECLALDDPIDQLVETARQYVRWGAANPNHYRFMLLQPRSRSDREWFVQEGEEGHYIPLDQEILARLYVVVESAIERGRLKEKHSDRSLVATTLWAGVHGAVLVKIGSRPRQRALMGERDTTLEARFDALKEAFPDGYLKEQGDS